MKSILDPSFRYTKSIDTDLRKTFARVRKEQLKSVPTRRSAESTVVPLGRRRSAL